MIQLQYGYAGPALSARSGKKLLQDLSQPEAYVYFDTQNQGSKHANSTITFLNRGTYILQQCREHKRFSTLLAPSTQQTLYSPTRWIGSATCSHDSLTVTVT